MDLMNIATMNSEAVAFFQKRDTEHAKEAIVGALANLRRICYCQNPEKNEDCSTCYGAEFPGDQAKANVYSVAPANESKDPLRQEVYNMAFLLSSDIPVDPTETAAVLLYNLGLINHITGLQTGQCSYVDTALSFYKKSLALLDSDMDLVVDSGALLVMRAAICHNMAQIYASLYQREESEEMIDDLTNTIEMMQSLSHTIKQDDFDFFCTRVHFLLLTNALSAPAA